MLKSGKRGKIEQALYEMRVDAKKGSGEAYSDMVGNPKYAGDVDLIMKHGMQNVEIDRGRVKLQGNANNIVSTTTKYEGLDKQASYEEEGTTTYVVSQKGSSSGGEETSSGTNEKVTKMSEGLILSNSGSESNNSYDVLAKR